MADMGAGSMTAVIGFDRFELQDLVSASDQVVIANDNSDSQVVLSGIPEALKNLTDQIKAKRIIPLNVSGAFHSPLMSEASKLFEKDLEELPFDDAVIPVLSNSDPTPTCEATLLKARLKDQMTNGVRWRETMQIMQKEGIKNFIEIGPGNVLSGLAKRSMDGLAINQISGDSDLGH